MESLSWIQDSNMFLLEFNEVQYRLLRLQVTLCVLLNSKVIYCEIYMPYLSLHWKVYLSYVPPQMTRWSCVFWRLIRLFFLCNWSKFLEVASLDPFNECAVKLFAKYIFPCLLHWKNYFLRIKPQMLWSNHVFYSLVI